MVNGTNLTNGSVAVSGAVEDSRITGRGGGEIGVYNELVE